MPDRSAAYDEGFEAWINGRPETDNPYDPEDTERHLDWNDGWISGEDSSFDFDPCKD